MPREAWLVTPIYIHQQVPGCELVEHFVLGRMETAKPHLAVGAGLPERPQAVVYRRPGNLHRPKANFPEAQRRSARGEDTASQSGPSIATATQDKHEAALPGRISA